MNDKAENDYLNQLVFSGKLSEIKSIIEAGVDLNKAASDKFLPIMTAVEGDQPEVLELLLRNGANPDKQSELDGWTALHLAVDYAMDGMIQNNRSEPYPETIECIRILLNYGADKNIKDNRGKTPLDLYPVTKEILAEFEAL